jgi:hypothetical protein
MRAQAAISQRRPFREDALNRASVELWSCK